TFLADVVTFRGQDIVAGQTSLPEVVPLRRGTLGCAMSALGHKRTSEHVQSTLYTRKRTLLTVIGTSALCQKRNHENGAFEPVSKRTGLCFREMDFCRQRQTRRSGPNANFAFEGDKSRARNAANSGHSATIREISVRARLRGGAERKFLSRAR